jgi:aconitate hydratase
MNRVLSGIIMTSANHNPFGSRSTLDLGDAHATIFSLPELDRQGLVQLDRLPFSIRILLENALRHCGRGPVTQDQVQALAGWRADASAVATEIPFMPARVVLQDFTGVPAVVDLAAMRDAMARLAGDPTKINPVVPCDLVIDHSVQVDYFGTGAAFRQNVDLEFSRNRERYQLLKFSQQAFDNFRVVPPGTGIVHQVNLEYLAPVVQLREQYGELTAYPDTLVGTDSHTTMINGLGVMGWGVGGIEAEAVMLGQPYFMLIPQVVGMKLVGRLPVGTTATDLVLRVTELLRHHGVVEKFVEFYGPALSHLSLADQATIANMSPEYGATMGFFPIDDETVRYLQRTGRPAEVVDRVERYCKEQGLFRTDDTPDPEFSSSLELDLSTIRPSLAGPRRPQDRVDMADLKRDFAVNLKTLMWAAAPPERHEVAEASYSRWMSEGGGQSQAVVEAPSAAGVSIDFNGETHLLDDGAVVIAAITSCTNTSNPSVMIGAGLVAKKAVERGLTTKPWVKTSLAPGSRVVTEYLDKSGLNEYLDELRFNLVGYGCTTCIGNSGPLPAPIADAIENHHLVTAAVLSGNRNFEARVHPQVRASYLTSPMLVVAYALAGTVRINLTEDPLGYDSDDNPVFLADLWPSAKEISDLMDSSVKPEMFTEQYGAVFQGDDDWSSLPVPEGNRFDWAPDSTYVREPPFFQNLTPEPAPLEDVQGARALAVLGDTITTDHISPAGSIPRNGPAARYLEDHGVERPDWNTFGSRRGNHQVMMRGTFGNVRIKNLLTPGKEGNWTVHFPSGEILSMYDAAMRYAADNTPLVVLAGKEYGTGSSRDWAAKGTLLLGVRAVLTESFERIHRSNLVGMGVLPLNFAGGDTRESLGLTGREVFDIVGIAEGLEPGGTVTVTATADDGGVKTFPAVVKLNSDVELDYYRNGGILQRVLRRFSADSR